MRHGPEALVHENRPFCGRQRDGHDDEQRDCGKTREQTHQHECSTDNLEATDDGPKNFRKREADLEESSRAKLIREQELLNALRQEDGADQQPD